MTALAVVWAEMILEECVRHGLTHVGIAPGARSAPLVVAATQHKDIQLTVHFDERALGFWALGVGKASGKPALVITTSGTAVANVLPAVIEAAQASVPMLICSADRPYELHDCGSNQTINQDGIFSSFTRWAITIPPAALDIEPGYVLSTLDYAWYKATVIHPGPVHLNMMFREPLLSGVKCTDDYLRRVNDWKMSKDVYTSYTDSKGTLDEKQMARCKRLIGDSLTGCFIAGGMTKESANAVLSAAEKLGWPIVAEAGSGLTLVDHPLIQSPQSVIQKTRDVGIVVGDSITLKSIASITIKNRIVIHSSPVRLDSNHQGGEQLIGDISVILSDLVSCSKTTHSFEEFKPNDVGSPTHGNLTEESAIAVLTRFIKPEWNLFSGNSLTIRYLTTHSERHLTELIAVFTNRGASGIDGNIATVAGIQTALNKPVLAVMGDQTFLHDMTSLQLLKQVKGPVCVVVINNYGGKIFSNVFQNMDSKLSDYFHAPHQLSFSHIAKQFDISYISIKTIQEWASFLAQYKDLTTAIVELCIIKEEN